MEPHVILDDTEVRPPLPHPRDGSKFKVPLVPRYNNRDGHLKDHNLMANHVVTILPPRQLPTSSPNSTTEHWLHINKTTVEVTIRKDKV